MLRAQPKRPRLPLLGLSALSATAALILVTELLPVGLLPQMSGSLGVSEGRVGFLATAYAGAATLAAIPLTAVTRGLPRRPLLLGLLAGFAVANAATALSSSYWVTFAVRLLVGLLGGIAWSMLAGCAARMVPAARRGQAIAIVLAGITLALAVGLPAATAMAAWTGWRGCFGVLAVIALALAVWVRGQVPALSGERASEGGIEGGIERGATLLRVARRPGVTAVLAVTALVLLGHQAMYTYLAPYVAHSGLDQPGEALLAFGVSAVAGTWLTGALVDRGPRFMTGCLIALMAAALLAIGLVGAHPTPLLGAVALWGLAFGGVPTALQTTLVRAAGVADASAAGSLQTTVYNLGVAAGSLAGGLVIDDLGPGPLPGLAGAVVLAAAALAAGRLSPAGKR